MNDGDLLGRMVREAREVLAGEHADPDASRKVILATARKRHHRRKHALALVGALAAVLAFSTAWGASGRGRHLPWSNLLGRLWGERTSVEPATVERVPVERSLARLDPASVPKVIPSSMTTGRAVDSLPTEPAAQVPIAKVIKRELSVAASRSVDEDDLLYAAAHRAHFVEGDANAALSAWDAYLRAHPDGRLSVEARYNRALCLVRLRRNQEARTVLVPFRDGRFGAYRQREAAALIQELEEE
jgi:hypothetical protein